MIHYNLNFILLILSLFCLTACTSNDGTPKEIKTVEIIKGRNFLEGGTLTSRLPIYRAKVPLDWIRYDCLPSESLSDTTKPLCTFHILDKETKDSIRITIHNFPSEKIEHRIPVKEQINRWLNQFETISSQGSVTCQESFNGFIGMYLSTAGSQPKAPDLSVLGWALQLPKDHYHALTPHPSDETSKAKYLQMRADVTIKAQGTSWLMQRHQEAIEAFARSFELIDEIP